MSNETNIPAKDFCRYHHIELSFLQSLADYGLLELAGSNDNLLILPDQVAEAEKMIRMHYDLQVNIEGIDVIRNLLEQITAMQAEILALRNRLGLYENTGA